MVEASLGLRPRAASERPNTSPGQGGQTRAASTQPGSCRTPITRDNASFRDNGIYECNYESVECKVGGSSHSDQAIAKLEQAVRSIDKVLAKDTDSKFRLDRSEGKVQYDRITVLPLHVLEDLPPPPLPRTRSFREGLRARSTPWGQGGGGGARATSAPPVSPAVGRRYR